MNNYTRFLLFEVVVEIPSEEEFEKFKNAIKDLKLEYTENILKCPFKHLRFNVPNDIACMEYQLSKGYTFGPKKAYEDYGCEVITVDDLIASLV